MNTNSKAMLSGHLLLGQTISETTELSRNRTEASLTIEIPSHIDFVAQAVDKIIRRIRRIQRIPGKEDDVAMALFEAVANAVTHGNHEQVTKHVKISCRFEPMRCVSIVVKDEGEGFDPRAVPDPTRPGNLESEHGRGIFLMRTAMDEVRYANGGSEVHLVKKCGGILPTAFTAYMSRVRAFLHAHLGLFKN